MVKSSDDESSEVKEMIEEMSEIDAFERSLIGVVDSMGDVEREMILDLARRVSEGQKQYGQLSLYKKRWTREAVEELMDNCVYMWMAMRRFMAEAGD